MATLEEQFRRRKLPTHTVQLPADPDGYSRLARALSGARWVLEDARARSALDTAAERAEVERLEAELDAAPIVEVKLTALPPAEWEDLVARHPPTPENLALGHQWNIDSFRPALLAASVGADSPDWDLLVKEGRMTVGELQGLFDAAIMLNVRGLSIAVGKER